MKKLKVIGNDAVFSKTVVNEVEDVPSAVNLCDAAMVSVKVGYVGSRMYDALATTDRAVPLRYEITGNTHNTVVLFIAGNDRRFQRSGDVHMEIAYSTDGEMMRKVFDSNIFTYLSATEYALALHTDNAQKYLEGYVVRTADDEGMEVTESILPLGSYTTYREGEYNLIKAIREDADAHNGRLTRNRYKFAYIANNEIREFIFDVVNFSDVYNPDKEVNTPSVTLVRMSYDGHIEIAANVWLCDATEQHYYDADGNIVYLVGVYRKNLEDYNIIGTTGIFYCNWQWHDITDGMRTAYKYDIPTPPEHQTAALIAAFGDHLEGGASYYIRNADNITYSLYIYNGNELVLVDSGISSEPSTYVATKEDFERRISALERGVGQVTLLNLTDIDGADLWAEVYTLLSTAASGDGCMGTVLGLTPDGIHTLELSTEDDKVIVKYNTSSTIEYIEATPDGRKSESYIEFG